MSTKNDYQAGAPQVVRARQDGDGGRCGVRVGGLVGRRGEDA